MKIKKSFYGIVESQSDNENALILADMDKVARKAGITHRSVNKLIDNYKNDLRESSSVRFKIAPGSNHKKTYLLDSAQCAFIIIRMNSKGATKLQKDISNVFAYKEHKQIARRATHDITKDSTKELEQAIYNNLNPKPNDNLYRNFKRLIYKLVLNKSVTQLKKERGATGNKRRFLTTDELRAVEKIQHEMTLLISLGNDYHQVRDILNEKYRITYNVPVKKLINQ